MRALHIRLFVLVFLLLLILSSPTSSSARPLEDTAGDISIAPDIGLNGPSDWLEVAQKRLWNVLQRMSAGRRPLISTKAADLLATGLSGRLGRFSGNGVESIISTVVGPGRTTFWVKVDDAIVLGKPTCEQEVEVAHRLTHLLDRPPEKLVRLTNTEWLAWSRSYEVPAIHNEVSYFSKYCRRGSFRSNVADMTLLRDRGDQRHYQQVVQARLLDEKLFKILTRLDLADPAKAAREFEQVVKWMERSVADYREGSYVPERLYSSLLTIERVLDSLFSALDAGKSKIHDMKDLRQIETILIPRYNTAAGRIPAIKAALWEEMLRD